MTVNEQIELNKLGERLRKFRIENKYSQETFADKTQLDRTYISSLERGKRNPSYLILVRLANSLGVTVDRLFNEEE